MKASSLCWLGGGKQSPNDGYKLSKNTCTCATCGNDIDGDSVLIKEIENPSFGNHADFFKFGSQSVCIPCAWMFGMGKGKPGNYIAMANAFEQTVISLESVVEDKRPWLDVIKQIATMPSDTQVTGVITTDVKIRLWPRTRVCTVGNFGLYVHCPDYDVSRHIDFSIKDLLRAIDIIIPALTVGFAKASCWYGLMRDYARLSKDPERAMALEMQLSNIRRNPEFLPALLMAGVTKEGKKVNENPRDVKSAAEGRGEDYPSQLGLL